MLHFTEADVRARLDPPALIRALAEAFARLGSDAITMPPRQVVELAPGTVLLIMPCSDAARANAAHSSDAVVSMPPSPVVRFFVA